MTAVFGAHRAPLQHMRARSHTERLGPDRDGGWPRRRRGELIGFCKQPLGFSKNQISSFREDSHAVARLHLAGRHQPVERVLDLAGQGALQM